MSEHASRLKWGRIAIAGIAATFVDDLVFGLIPFVGWVVSPFAALVTPVLTALFALWVARTVAPPAAVKHGVMVGVVAGAIAFLVALPSLWAPAAAAVTVAAGALGGLAGDRARSQRKPVERSPLDV